MNKVFSILAVMIVSSAAMANDPISCYKSALADNSVLAANKTYYAGPTNALELEDVVIRLCSKASSGNDPIACFKNASADSKVLAANKIYYAGSANAVQLEDVTISLCAGYSAQ